jgi:N-methylhydantoinase A
MLRALRLVSVERGHDPGELTLVAFGGAGPLHACALAEELGMETVLVPAAAGVLSALGLAIAGRAAATRELDVCALDDAGELPARGRGGSCATAASRSS